MPIIQDPRMNPHKERQHGIIEINGVYAYYDKKNKKNNKRFMPSGFVVDDAMIVHLEHYPPETPILYKGQIITIKAEFEIPDNYEETQGPVTEAIYKYLKNEFDKWPESELS
jgi:hypothetical protein